MSHICKYCKSEFSTRSNLISHQKRTKYCLKIQGKNNNTVFECKYCNKILASEKRLKTHYEICSKYNENKLEEKLQFIIKEKDSIISQKDSIIKELKDQIKDLQDKLENIAIKAVERPTSTTNNMKTNINNFIQNMQPVTTENLLEHTENLTLEHVQKGASGYAEYALEYPFKDRIACVDYSRRKMKF